ncbi:transmembrane and coiled-coil domain-containing protein 3 isoform X7 [Pan troglodytes]
MKVLGRSFFWVLFPVLPWAVQAVEHEEVAQHVIKLHRGRGVAAMQSRQWVRDSCRKLSGLLRQKNAVLNKLKTAIGAVEKDMGLSDEEKLFQVHTFEIFQKELNESENSVFQAVYGLQRALQGDYKDVVNMKESSRQRLEALREAAIKEETEYMELLAAEKHQVEALKNMQHQNQSLSMLDEILEDVRKAADRLEEEIEEHAFDDNKSVKGVNFEAVLRVEEEEANSKQNITKREVEDDLGLSMLIDSQNNQYILTKPRDSTIPRADHHFIKDIVTIGMLSLPCGWLCTAIGLPTMFGYIICGVLLGPSGLNSIKVWKISLQGPCYMTLLMIAFGLLWGHLLRIKPTQSVFISTCLSLSSTPLVSRFLMGSARGDKEGDIDYSTVLLGMLVTQDVQLGLFMAVMPTLIQAGASASSRSDVLMGSLSRHAETVRTAMDTAPRTCRSRAAHAWTCRWHGAPYIQIKSSTRVDLQVARRPVHADQEQHTRGPAGGTAPRTCRSRAAHAWTCRWHGAPYMQIKSSTRVDLQVARRPVHAGQEQHTRGPAGGTAPRTCRSRAAHAWTCRWHGAPYMQVKSSTRVDLQVARRPVRADQEQHTRGPAGGTAPRTCRSRAAHAWTCRWHGAPYVQIKSSTRVDLQVARRPVRADQEQHARGPAGGTAPRTCRSRAARAWTCRWHGAPYVQIKSSTRVDLQVARRPVRADQEQHARGPAGDTAPRTCRSRAAHVWTCRWHGGKPES